MLATKVSVDCKIPIDNVKSRFIEMFGNPVSNSICWPTKKMIDVAPSVQFSQEPMHDSNWLLNLDAIQSNSGEILFKNIVSRDKLTGSIMSFGMGNVLYSKLRPYLNKVVVPNEPGFGTTELIPLLPNPELLNQTYFACLLRSDPFVNNISLAVAGTKMPRVSMGTFWKFDVPLPPIDLQNEFATFVKQVDKSKAICKQIFQSFDNLVKSRFIEMFGTDVNPKYGHIKVGEVVSKKIGRVSKQFSTDSIIQYIDIASIDKDSKRILSTTEYVVSEAPSRAQQCVEEGDILLSNVRPNLRTISIVHLSGSNLVCSTGFSVLRCELYLPEYFLMAISSDSFTEHLMSKATGSSYPAVTTKDVMNQTIPAAPLELQKKFSDFVRQVDKSKFSDGLICSR